MNKTKEDVLKEQREHTKEGKQNTNAQDVESLSNQIGEQSNAPTVTKEVRWNPWLECEEDV
jgi:hypothetical protein